MREVRFEDYPQIAALGSKFQLVIESYDAWRHLWADNPSFRERKGVLPMGWVLDTGGEIAGYLGNIPLDYELEGQKLLAATTRAWVVDTPYRTYSPLLLGTYFQQPNVDLFLSTTVNSQSASAYGVFESLRVPVGAWDRTLFWIIHYQGFAESLLRRSSGTLAKPLSYPLAAGAFLFDKLRGSDLRKQGSQVKVIPCESFDERFQAFWETLRKQKFHLLIGVRSQEALTWHFKFELLHNTAWIYSVESESGLAAYAVFSRHDYGEIGLTRVRLVDFQCLDREKEPEILLAILEAAMARCRQESIHMLEIVGLAPELEKILASASPHNRSLGAWLYFYKTKDAVLAEKLNDPTVWEPSLFDGDSSL